MNRIVYSFLLILFLGMSNISVCAEGTQPSVGNGTPANPYQIGTAAELVWFRDHVNVPGRANAGACAKLIADIDLSSVCSSTLGSWVPIACHSEYYISSSDKNYWTGTFDGDGHKISNLYIHNTTNEYIGLFGMINGTIKNLTVEGTVQNGSTSSSYGGGLLFGRSNINTEIQNCTTNGTVDGEKAMGGMGCYCAGNFHNCVNYANVHINGNAGIGGIGSYYENGTLSGCINYGNITTNIGVSTAGGLMGSVYSNITVLNCGNSGNITVTGETNVGGLIGEILDYTMSIKNSFNCGNIINTNKETPTNYNSLGYILGRAKTPSKVTFTGNIIINSNATYERGTVTVTKAVGNGSQTATSLPSTDFTSGKVCYLLNGDQSTINWYQSIGTDNCPTPIGNTNSTVYRVAVNAGEKFINENGTIAQITFTDGEDFITPVAFTITDALYSRTMTNNWGTLCLPYALNTSECCGVEFYEISSISNESITLTQITGAIDAGKPVFYLKPTGAASINFNATNAVIQPTAGTTTESISLWNTIGTYTNQSITDNTNAYYFVASDKIYPKEPSRALTVKPFRAYLSAPSNAGARQFSIKVMGETTAVDALNSLNDDNVQIYDINGIRKSSLSKGINIINGKKIIIR